MGTRKGLLNERNCSNMDLAGPNQPRSRSDRLLLSSRFSFILDLPRSITLRQDSLTVKIRGHSHHISAKGVRVLAVLKVTLFFSRHAPDSQLRLWDSGCSADIEGSAGRSYNDTVKDKKVHLRCLSSRLLQNKCYF